MYTVRYHTGAGDCEAIDLDAAKQIADDGAAYTQQSITIEDEDGNEVSRRQWYGTASGWEEEDSPICFGTFGFYADWLDA